MEAVSVSALTKYLQAKFSRDRHLQYVKLRGELSNVKLHNKGHLYFTLKDTYSKISGVAFSQALAEMDIDAETFVDGLEVEIEGSVRVYEGTGTYQVYATQITPSGVGILQKQYQELFEKYQKAGYFDEGHKQVVPKRIHRLALITAEDGAAIEDMKKILYTHIPHVEMVLFPTLVQGDGAPKRIAKALQKADAQHFDAIVVGRGGGSLEDLWAFNAAEVIEAIYAATTPIISAVGHAIDTMLSDHVADERAITPTDAIYYFTSTAEIGKQLEACTNKVRDKVLQIIQDEREKLQLTYQQVKERDPRNQIQYKQNELHLSLMRLEAENPGIRVDTYQKELAQLEQMLQHAMRRLLEQQDDKITMSQKTLDVLNPHAQLERGYALVYEQDRVVTKVEDIQSDVLRIQLQDGQIHVKVVKQDG